jgi:hypothetical protein
MFEASEPCIPNSCNFKAYVMQRDGVQTNITNQTSRARSFFSVKDCKCYEEMNMIQKKMDKKSTTRSNIRAPVAIIRVL